MTIQQPILEVLRVVFNLFSKRDKKLILAIICFQIFLGFLDLLSVILIGLIGSLAVSGISSGTPGNRVLAVLKFFHISEFTVQEQAALLGISAAILLVSKTLMSIYFTRRSLKFISLRSAQISADLLKKVLVQDLQQLKSQSFQKTLYSVTNGIDLLAVGVVGTLVMMISDVSLAIIMIIGLLALDKLLAGATLIFFGFVAFMLHKLLAGRAQKISSLQTDFGIKSSQQILEVLGAYREIFVKNRREYYADLIGSGRKKIAEIGAEKAFLPSVSKYVFEITTVIGAFVISAFQFLKTDAMHAVTILTIFLAASARISPAVLRVQQGLLTLRGSAASAIPSLELISKNVENSAQNQNSEIRDLKSFKAHIQISNLTFHYEENNNFSVTDLNLEIFPGEIVALVGPSGSGKSTLVDLILGLLQPKTGKILISGIKPIENIKAFPGMIGYVPQDTNIFEGTIKENVALGFPEGVYSDTQILHALELAALKDFVEEAPDKLNTLVGERGTRLSGGQRQRIGIARAILSNPKLLILDEATSSLDGQTELEISQAINSLKGASTVIVIAHRLSTVKNSDKVVYLENGRIRAIGKFNEIRSIVPNFDKQAKLMGL